jgi:hypothetical protein
MAGFLTRKVKCRDGSIHFIYRNPRRAFPLALRNTTSRIDASVDALNGVKAGLAADNERVVSALLIRLDETNQNMQAEFNAVYVTYASNPCRDPDYLPNKVDQILRAKVNLQELLAQVRIIEQMIESGERGQPLFEALHQALNLSRPSDERELESRVNQAPEDVARWSK